MCLVRPSTGGLRRLKGTVKGSSPSSPVGGLAGPPSHCSASWISDYSRWNNFRFPSTTLHSPHSPDEEAEDISRKKMPKEESNNKESIQGIQFPWKTHSALSNLGFHYFWAKVMSFHSIALIDFTSINISMPQIKSDLHSEQGNEWTSDIKLLSYPSALI